MRSPDSLTGSLSGKSAIIWSTSDRRYSGSRLARADGVPLATSVR
jgi:hypothetical protein